jgi:hypothetical protein
MQKPKSKLKGKRLSRCSALLGRRRMGTKSCDDGFGSALRTVDNSENKLGKVKSYPGVIAILIDALKKKGMRFKEVSFKNGDITNDDKNVVVFRGDAAKVLHRAFHGCPSSAPAHQAAHNVGLVINGECDISGGNHNGADILKMSKIIHKCSLPNAGTHTRRADDVNRDSGTESAIRRCVQ